MKLLKKLQLEGKIATKGKARATRYYIPLQKIEQNDH